MRKESLHPEKTEDKKNQMALGLPGCACSDHKSRKFTS